MNIVLIGAGNLATQVGKAIAATPAHKIIQVYSRTEASAKTLADTLHTEFTTDLKNIVTDADLYLFSVKDAALESVLQHMPPVKGICAHTAGSIPISVFESFASHFGVFYPLQTFSKTKDISLKDVPFFIEGNTPSTEQTLFSLAGELSSNVRTLDSAKRKEIHLAAVFVCNFTNHMYAIAADILESKGIPFDVLVPLITETTTKLKNLHPKEAQTGPAIRYDQNVMSNHIDMLPEAYKEIYRLLSESIHQMHTR